MTPDGSELAYASGTPDPYGAGTPYGDLNADYPGINEHIIVQNVATGSRQPRRDLHLSAQPRHAA
jgi:hypothetical protein